MGIQILVPDINASNLEFTATDKGIRFGLGAVKNVGDKAVGAIVAERDRNGPYKSFYDFCERVDLRAADKTVLESLIKGGALDSFGLKRSVLINSLEEILSIAGRRQHDKRTGQLALMGKAETSATAGYPALPDSPELPEDELLRYEKDILGFYITGHPLAQYEKLLKELTSTTIGQLSSLRQNAEVKIGGVLTNIRLAGGEKSKFDKTARERYAYFKLRDLTGVTDAAVYSEEFKRYRSLVHDNKIVLLKGRLDLSKGMPLVKVKEMSPLERAYESMPNRVTINISLAGFEDGAMEGLKDILLAHPGTCPVFLEMNRTDNSRVLLKVGSDYSVTISDRFREDIDELLGTGRIELK
ncbi:MAG: hypothetical protein HY762_04025 [Planctomycetes bacterium]|nr:hypothetical protein [Planctomycetota bacterium]